MPAKKPSKKLTTIGKRRQIWCSALSFSITYSERSRRGPSFSPMYLRCGDRSFGSVAIRRPTSIMRQDQTICRHPQRMAPCQLPAGAGHRPKARHIPEEKGRSKRAMPMRLRQEIQEMLRSQLIVAPVLTGGLRRSDLSANSLSDITGKIFHGSRNPWTGTGNFRRQNRKRRFLTHLFDRSRTRSVLALDLQIEGSEMTEENRSWGRQGEAFWRGPPRGLETQRLESTAVL
jgi:hypothetical protein